MLKQEKSRLDPPPSGLVVKFIGKHIKQMELQLKQIDQEMKKLRDRSVELETSVKRITEVKGIGELSALALLGFVPELEGIRKGLFVHRSLVLGAWFFVSQDAHLA